MTKPKVATALPFQHLAGGSTKSRDPFEVSGRTVKLAVLRNFRSPTVNFHVD